MTNEPDPHPSDPWADDETVRPRLDQARAELTGHPPVPDQRLAALFLTGYGPVGPTGDEATPTIELEPAGGGGPSSPRTRVLITAIAAAFLLVMGLAVYAAGRGDSDSPVEIAGDTAESDTADSDSAGPDDSGPATLAQSAQDQEPEHEGWETLAPELTEQLKSLWAANRDWVDCVTDAVDAWADSPGAADGDAADFRHGLPLLAECGFPSFDDLDLPDFVLPGFDLDEMDLPEDFSFGDLEGLGDLESLGDFDWRAFLDNIPGLEEFSFDLDRWDAEGGTWDPSPQSADESTDPEA